MTNLSGKIVLVTGASAGIGFAAAETLAKHGMKVIGCARNIQAIQDLSKKHGGDSIQAVKCDMTQENEVLDMFRGIKERYGRLDVLINNAGMGGSGTNLLTGSYDAWQTMLNLNVLGLTLASREAVKLMEESDSKTGHIINVNSVAGHYVPPNPMRQFYSGTKHMVLALTEGMRKAFATKNIRVTSLSPGAVETEFAQRSYGKEDPELAATIYVKNKCLEAKDLADAIVYILSAPSHVNIDELTITPTSVVRAG